MHGVCVCVCSNSTLITFSAFELRFTGDRGKSVNHIAPIFVIINNIQIYAQAFLEVSY